MSDEQTGSGSEWREVGDQFRILGDQIAAALRTTWESEGTRQGLRDLQTGLEHMVSAVGQAIDEASASPTGQRVREEALRAATSARAAGQEAWRDAQPQVLSALRRASAEFERVLGRANCAQPPAPSEDEAQQ
jgi:hypothetical protein